MPATSPANLTAEEWDKALELLRTAEVAYLALVDGGRPYVVPLNFAYVPGEAACGGAPGAPDTGPVTAADAAAATGRLVFHTGPGRKSAALAADARVCVAVTNGGSFVQGDTPCQDGFAFRSVLIEGRAALLRDATERDGALWAIVAKHDPTGVAKPFDGAVLARTLVYAVEIETLGYRER
jgi:nitroimidazol reductase NimA-like FMN-containing flavoprotein (pyridoxamine 5'-phosphate oxidase superfamily)